MRRRSFLIGGGIFVSAALVGYGVSRSEDGSASDKDSRRPDPKNFDEPALKAMAFGMSAPNPHNTQAWKFKLLSDLEFLLYVDKNRLLSATDPTTRQQHIGCGCFLSVMEAGMSTLGYRCQIGILPEGEYDLDGTGIKPVASVRIERSTEVKAAHLANSIPKRRTNRMGYTDIKVSQEEFLSMVAATAPKYCSIRLVDDASVVADHMEVHFEAMCIESKTHAAYDESRIWFRENDAAIASKRDGINLPAGGTTGITRLLAETMLKGLDEKTWHKPSTIEQHLSGYRKKVMKTRAIVHFVTSTNTLRDWIYCGIDYARFQLAATSSGWYIHPMSQVLQEYPEMDALRVRYDGMCGIASPAKMQMVVRIGKGDVPFESYRRDVKGLLIA